MKLVRITTIMFLLSIVVGAVNAQELPPTAQPGKCYVKCITPDEYREVIETIVVRPEHKVLSTTPATFKTVEERVLIKEASKRFVVHPVVYETVTESYQNRAPETSLEVVPARFGSSSRTIQVAPKSGRWEYTTLANCPSVNKEDCIVACYVEYPEVNETFPITVLEAEATTRPSTKAGTTATYRKQVVKTAPRVEEIEIPAEYSTIRKVIVDVPSQVNERIVPAETRVITKRELVSKGGITTWEEVDCSLLGAEPNLLPIFYDLNSAKITPASERIIDEYLLKLMRDKPGLRIELMSHTDSRGDDAYNMALSQQRAQSVVNYLVNKGIARNRLVATGYGETRLKNRCANGVQCSEEEHQQNRRTEFRIIQ